MTKIHLGISTCPNDTFAFHGLLTQKVDWRGLDFTVELLDVQELNQRLMRGQFDVAKASFHAAVRLSDHLGVLPSGSALGFGNGPLLLAARDGERPRDGTMTDESQASYRVLCPGEQTTAYLLYRLFYDSGQVEQAVFSEIMPSLLDKTADFGVCIHEGRFTWEKQGLSLVEDLGARWEAETNSPLPLGGILARHTLGPKLLGRVQSVIHDSLQYGLAHRDETLPTLRKYAQEFDDDVLMAHVDLYVNQWTVDLGREGELALECLGRMAKQRGLISESSLPLQVVGR